MNIVDGILIEKDFVGAELDKLTLYDIANSDSEFIIDNGHTYLIINLD